MTGGSLTGRNTIRTVLFSTLFPSSVRPYHGIFVETRLHQLLGSGNVETRVVAPVPWFPSRNERFQKWSAYAGTPLFERKAGVDVWHPRYLLPPKVGMNAAPLLLALGARATVAKLIRDRDFDLIDAHYYYPDGAAAALLSYWFNKPFVVTGRGTDLNLLPDFAVPRAWIRWTEQRAAQSVLVSQALKQRLTALRGDPTRMMVIRNGVDLERFRRVPIVESQRRLGLPKKRWILSVGNLVAEKGHATVIEALTHLPVDVALLIVGDGRDARHLKAFTIKHGLEGRVIFAGRRSQEELPYWYSAAELLVLCSEREGWPNVLLEAMACGTPVVATAVGGIPEIISDPVAGRLVRERNSETIAAAVLELMESRARPEDVREYASMFSWQETTRAQLKLFREIVLRTPTIRSAQTIEH